MEPLLVLVIMYIITLAAGYLYRKQLMFPKAARIALSVMFFYRAIPLCLYRRNGNDAATLPASKRIFIYITGIIEMILALGIFSDKKTDEHAGRYISYCCITLQYLCGIFTGILLPLNMMERFVFLVI